MMMMLYRVLLFIQYINFSIDGWFDSLSSPTMTIEKSSCYESMTWFLITVSKQLKSIIFIILIFRYESGTQPQRRQSEQCEKVVFVHFSCIKDAHLFVFFFQFEYAIVDLYGFFRICIGARKKIYGKRFVWIALIRNAYGW